MWERAGHVRWLGVVVVSGLLGCSGEAGDGSTELLASARSALVETCGGADTVCEINAGDADDHADDDTPGSIAWYFRRFGEGYTYALRSGIFAISAGIEVPRYATLMALDEHATRIFPTAGSAFPAEKWPMIRLTDYSTLSAIHADGDSMPAMIVDARGTISATISDCTLRESRGSVVTADLSAGLSIRSSTISYAGIRSNRALPTENGTGHGINCFHCFDFEVKDSAVNYTRTAGIYMAGTLGAVIARNQIFQTSWNMLVSEHATDPAKKGWSAGDGITAYHNNSNPYPVSYNIYENRIWLFHNHGIHVSGDGINIHDNYVDGHNDQTAAFGHSAVWVGDHRPFPGGECSKHITIANNELYRGRSTLSPDWTREIGMENYQASTYQRSGNTGWTNYGGSGTSACNLYHTRQSVSPDLYYEFRYGVGVDTMNTRPAETQAGARTLVDERLGRVLDLEGNGDSLRIPDHAVFNTDKLTVFALVRPDQVNQTMQIFSKDCSSCERRSWQFRVTNDGRLELIVFSSPTVFATASSAPDTIEAGAWSYVAGTYDGATLRIYHAPLWQTALTEVGTKAFAGPLRSYVSDAYIGRAQLANPGYFLGRIDDVAFFKRALSKVDLELAMQWGHMTMADNELLHLE
jgi:hypothetical protein